MVAKRYMSIGDKLWLEVPNRLNEIRHKSQVLDILDNETIVISGPIKKGRAIPIKLGKVLHVSYFKENVGRFVFKARVMEVKTEGVYKIVVRLTDRIKKVQDRDFFRFNVKLHVTKTFYLDIDGEKKMIEEECVTEDLSGGGLKLLCNYSHKMGDKISCLLNLKAHGKIYAEGKIVRFVESKNAEYKYSAGIDFMEIDEEDREEIVKFIFEEQRKLRKKGLI